MRISMLGALAIRSEDGDDVAVGGARLRALLCWRWSRGGWCPPSC
ncbi:hypothetical protein AB0D94_01840 [Streptomyces sp. NPDC048255]